MLDIELLKKYAFIEPLLGIVAILSWSSMVAITRKLSEEIGTVIAASYQCLGAGFLGLFVILLYEKNIDSLLKIPVAHLLYCGLPFIIYMISFFLAMGLSKTREHTISIALINYLWPSLTLLFSVLFFGRYCNNLIILIVGIVLAFLGAYFAVAYDSDESYFYETIHKFLKHFKGNPISILLAFISAISWAIYTNMNNKLGISNGIFAIPIFFLIAGLILLVSKQFLSKVELKLSFIAILYLLYAIAVPNLLAYVAWTISTQNDKFIIVTIFSFFLPLISTMISCIYFNKKFTVDLIRSCVLILLGTVICNYAVPR